MNRRLIVGALILGAKKLLFPQNARFALCIASGAGRQKMHRCARCIGTFPSAARRRRSSAPSNTQMIIRACIVAHIALIRFFADIIDGNQYPRRIKAGVSEQRRGTTHGVLVVGVLRHHQKALGCPLIICADVMTRSRARCWCSFRHCRCMRCK